MSTIQITPKRPARVYRAPEFKSKLVKLALEPDASLSAVAVAHGVNPNLLRRWVKESGALTTPPSFVPVRIESSVSSIDRHVRPPVNTCQGIEVNINRGDLHIALNVDVSQILKLGQVLRQVLR
jgi:hypothetical protein